MNSSLTVWIVGTDISYDCLRQENVLYLLSANRSFRGYLFWRIFLLKKIAITIIKFIGFFLGWAILSSILPLSSSENPAIWRLWAEIMPLLAIIFFTLIFWLVEKKNMKLHLFDNPIKGTAVGVITGVVWLAIPVLIMYIAKIINFAGTNSITLFPI